MSINLTFELKGLNLFLGREDPIEFPSCHEEGRRRGVVSTIPAFQSGGWIIGGVRIFNFYLGTGCVLCLYSVCVDVGGGSDIQGARTYVSV